MSSEPIVVEATGLRAVFKKAGERWTHHIELTSSPAVANSIVMQSLEGLGDNPWPPSPAIQQLLFQREQDGTPAVMGIGMSGRSHWSFSCQAESIGNWGGDEARYLRFEAACRIQQGFERIGTCYHLLPEVSPLEQDGHVYYQTAEGEWGVSATGVDVICNANQTLSMDCFGDPELLLPQTVQWSYRMARSGKTMFELSTK